MSRFGCLLLLWVAANPSLSGQSFTGSISGLVTDPTGAVITGAAITITDIDKNSNYRTTSNATGFYSVSQLPPGNYRVTSELQGFRRFVADRLPLTTQQRATLDITMEVGAVTEQVEVTAEAQLLESATATLSGLVENKRILDLR